MVNHKTTRLDAFFSALADPTRRGIVESLARSHRTGRELAAPFSMSLPAISKHLKSLEKARIIRRKIHGRTHIFSLNTRSFSSGKQWLEFQSNFWKKSIDRLEEHLKNED